MTHDTPPKRIWTFDRYVNGILMAEGVEIGKAETFEQAAKAAARLASRGPKGEVPVLVFRDTSEAEAMVAAALREAADVVDARHAENIGDCPCHHVRALIPQPASAALDKLIAEAVKAERERVTRIAASLFPGGYDNNINKIEYRVSEIAAIAAHIPDDIAKARIADLEKQVADLNERLDWARCR
jgi:hypothetical protein